ncbi:MAG: hypothetical protein IKG04_07850 [Exiguobacterium sp.]|nr:hypothetical protein [Exiguobacterium sp.]
MGIQFQTLLQRQIQSEYLGRTLTVVYALQGMLAPFGYLFGGMFADWLNPILLYLIGALTLLVSSVYFRKSSFLTSHATLQDQAG